MPNPTCDNHYEEKGVFCDLEQGHNGQHQGTHGTTGTQYKWPISADSLAIKHVEKLEYTPYYLFALKGWIEIVEAGHADGGKASFYDNNPAIVMLDGDRPVSILVWTDSNGLCHICHGWTDPEYRRLGLYTRLYSALKEKAKEKGFKKISGGIAPSNHKMLEAAARQGRSPVAIYMEESLHA